MNEDESSAKNEILNKWMFDRQAEILRRGGGFQTENDLNRPLPVEPTLKEMASFVTPELFPIPPKREFNLRWEKKEIIKFRKKLIATVPLLEPTEALAEALNGSPMPNMETAVLEYQNWWCDAIAKCQMRRVDAIILAHEESKNEFAMGVLEVRERQRENESDA